MKPVLIECPTCSSSLRLSEALLTRVAGRTGKISCKGCGVRIRLDGRQPTLVVEFLGTQPAGAEVTPRSFSETEDDFFSVGSSDASGLEPRHDSSVPPPLPADALQQSPVALEEMARGVAGGVTEDSVQDPREHELSVEEQFFARGGTSFPLTDHGDFPREEQNTLSPQTISEDVEAHQQELVFPLVPPDSSVPEGWEASAQEEDCEGEIDGSEVASVRGEEQSLVLDGNDAEEQSLVLDGNDAEEQSLVLDGNAPEEAPSSTTPLELEPAVSATEISEQEAAHLLAEAGSATSLEEEESEDAWSDEDPWVAPSVASAPLAFEPVEPASAANSTEQEIEAPPPSAPCREVEEVEAHSVREGADSVREGAAACAEAPESSEAPLPPAMASAGDRMPKIQNEEWFKNHSQAASIPPAPPRPWEVPLKTSVATSFDEVTDRERVSYPPLPSPFSTERRSARGSWILPAAVAASLTAGIVFGAMGPFQRSAASSAATETLSPVAEALFAQKSAQASELTTTSAAASPAVAEEEADRQLVWVEDGEASAEPGPETEADEQDTAEKQDTAEQDEEVADENAASRESDGSDKSASDAAKAEVDSSSDDENEASDEEKAEEEAPPAPFSKRAAQLALTEAAGQASSCRKPGDPTGVARVVVTFSPSGRVTRTTVSGPPFAGTSTGGCIASVFRGASVPQFSGDYVTVSKTITVQ